MKSEPSMPACPIDGSHHTRYLAREGLHYCIDCRHAWTEAAETPAQYEVEYFASVYTRSPRYDEWLVGRYREMLDISRQLMPGLRTALDVGCGQGELVKFLGEHGVIAAGSETSARYAADCRDRGLDVHTGPSSDLEGKPTRYDLVTCLHVLEHLSDPSEVLRSLRALARPGGLVYIELPNELEAWRSRVKQLLGRPASTPEGRSRTGHRQCFSKRSIGRLATRNGLEVLRIDTRDVVEPHASAAHRLVVGVANSLARASLLQGNILRCWCRLP
jgi:SAM-dependent methyltransferase